MGFDWSGGCERRPPNYLSRKMQKRLLSMLMMLLLVGFAIQHAGRPETWHWLWRATGAEPPSADNTTSDLSSHLETKTSDQGKGLGRHPNVKPELLDSITDDTYFHGDEQNAWFHLLDVLRNESLGRLQQISLGPVTYLQISKQTDAYRGCLVDVSGTIRRAHLISAPQNSIGIEQYWQCWLFPDASNSPIVIYLLEPPIGLIEGMQIEFPIKLTGIVYKRWAFKSAEELTSAPVILAKSGEPTSADVSAETAKDDVIEPRRIGWMIAMIGLASCGVTFVIYRTTETRGKEKAGDVSAPLPSFEDIDSKTEPS